MLLHELGSKVAQSFREVKLLYPLYQSSYTVEEKAPQKKRKDNNTNLTAFQIKNLPDTNVWVFKSEIQDGSIECLQNTNNTVEEILLCLQDNRLYAFMIELKSSLSKSNIKKLKSKFSCSLVRLSIFLSGNPNFVNLKQVELFPMGITAFNDNRLYEIQEHDINRLPSYQQQLYDFQFTTQQPTFATTTLIQPVTLNRLALPMLFFQNPSWLAENKKDEAHFSIDFQKFLDYKVPKA